jgi:hypothetical protein
MRLVTMKPPAMFTAASVTARKPKNFAATLSESPVARIAPTTITERGRHAPHHVVTDEAGHQENGEQIEEGLGGGGDGRRGLGHLARLFGEHGRAVGDGRRLVGDLLGSGHVGDAPQAEASDGWTTAPARVNATPFTISSSSFNAGFLPSLSQKVVRKVSRLRA